MSLTNIPYTYILIRSLVLAGLACFVLYLLYKWKIIESYQVYRRRWMPLWCDFCALWWLGVIFCILLKVFNIEPSPVIFFCVPFIPVFGLFLFKR